MLRHRFSEIVIDDIRYFALPVGISVEELEKLELITLRQVGFNSPIYAITEQQIQELLANKDENE